MIFSKSPPHQKVYHILQSQMDKSENGRISRRVGWADEHEYPYSYGSTWKQKVGDWKTSSLFLFSSQGTRIAVKTVGTLSMIALFIWQVSFYFIFTTLTKEDLKWLDSTSYPWFCFEGKSCCGQVCQQVDQPPRKTPGILPILCFQQYLRRSRIFILQGLRDAALPKCHFLPKIHLENFSWGEFLISVQKSKIRKSFAVLEYYQRSIY